MNLWEMAQHSTSSAMDDLAIISLKVFVGTVMGIVVKMGAVYVVLFANLILCSSLRADYTLLSSRLFSKVPSNILLFCCLHKCLFVQKITVYFSLLLIYPTLFT